MVFDYNPDDIGTFKSLFSWHATMFPMVLTAPLIWMLMSIHVVHHIVRELQWEYYESFELDITAIGVLSAFTTFFLVFYGSQCYVRMQMLYGHCIALGGDCMEWSGLVRNSFPGSTQEDLDLRWNSARLVLASIHIHYYIQTGFTISEEEWKLMSTRSLLTDDEILIIQNFKGFKPFLPLVWALEEVEQGLLCHSVRCSSHIKGSGDRSRAQNRPSLPKSHSLLDDHHMRDLYAIYHLEGFRNIAFDLRGTCGQIANWAKMPVPYPYYHVLNVMLVINLLLIGYALVYLNKNAGLTTFTYFFICLISIGLKEVAVKMSDPFGTDVVDFDTDDMLTDAYENAVALLRDNRSSIGREPVGLLNPLYREKPVIKLNCL